MRETTTLVYSSVVLKKVAAQNINRNHHFSVQLCNVKEGSCPEHQ